MTDNVMLAWQSCDDTSASLIVPGVMMSVLESSNFQDIAEVL